MKINNNTRTQTQLELLQTKMQQSPSQMFVKQVIIATQGEQHIQPESGYIYEINAKNGEVVSADFNFISRKVDNDLEVIVENNAAIIFDNYFEVCAIDLYCLVWLPSKEGVVDNFTDLADDGSQIVHFMHLYDGSQSFHLYGNEMALSAIASNQSNLFQQSFYDVYLADSFVDDDVYVPHFTFDNTGGYTGYTIGPENTELTSSAPPIRGDKPIGKLTYRIAGGADASKFSIDPSTGGLTLANPNYELPEDVGGNNVYEVKIVATDDRGNFASVSQTFEVTDANDAPVIDTYIYSQDIYESAPFSLPFVVSDEDANDILEYDVSLAGGAPLPSWINFNPITNAFEGTANNSKDEVINVEVTVADRLGAGFTHTFALTTINESPYITSITSTTDNGHFKEHDDINISVYVDHGMSEGSIIYVNFLVGIDTSQAADVNIYHEVELTRDDTDATLFTGIYTVEDSHNHGRLNVDSITMDAVATDYAGNPFEDTFLVGSVVHIPLPDSNLADNTELVIDTTQPTILSITSTTDDGRYNAGNEIELIIEVDSIMAQGSQIDVMLSTMHGVTLTRDDTDAMLFTGTYTVQPGDNAVFNVININSLDMAIDLAGNELDTTLPATSYDRMGSGIILDNTVASPRVAVRHHEDQYISDDYINIDEDGINLEISFADITGAFGRMARGDEIRLEYDNRDLVGSYRVRDEDIYAGIATFFIGKTALGGYDDETGRGDGDKLITAIVTDVAGNIDSSEFTVTIDTIRPIIDMVTIGGRDRDANAMVSDVMLFTDVDGGDIITITGTSNLEYGDTFNVLHNVNDYLFAAGDMMATTSENWDLVTAYPEYLRLPHPSGLPILRETPVAPVIVFDEVYGVDAVLIDDNHEGMMMLERYITPWYDYSEWEAMSDYGAQAYLRMRMDRDNGMDGGNFAFILDYIGLHIIGETGRATPDSHHRGMWNVEIKKDPNSDAVMVNGNVLVGTKYYEYNDYEMVLDRGPVLDSGLGLQAHLTVNGHLVDIIDWVAPSQLDTYVTIRASQELTWSSDYGTDTDGVVYIEEIGLDIFEGDPIQARVIDDYGNWESSMSVAEFDLNRYNSLAIHDIDVAGNINWPSEVEDRIFFDVINLPMVTSVNIDTSDGSYEMSGNIVTNKITGDVIIITARVSETVDEGSTITLRLDLGTNADVELRASEDGTILTGEYIIHSRDRTIDDNGLTALGVQDIGTDVTIDGSPSEMMTLNQPRTNIDDQIILFINVDDTTPPTVVSMNTVLTEHILWTNMEEVTPEYNDMYYQRLWNDITVLESEAYWELFDRSMPRLFSWFSGAISQQEFNMEGEDFAISSMIMNVNNYNTNSVILGISNKDDTYNPLERAEGDPLTYGEVYIRRAWDIDYGIQMFYHQVTGKWQLKIYADDSPRGTGVPNRLYKIRGDTVDAAHSLEISTNVLRDIIVQYGDIVTFKKQGDQLIYLLNNEIIHTIAAPEHGIYHIDTTMKTPDTALATVLEYDLSRLIDSSTARVSTVYTFSEKVIGITADDFDVVNGRIISIDVTNPDINGFSSTWKVDIAPIDESFREFYDVTLTLRADSVTDQAGIGNVGSHTRVFAVDKFFVNGFIDLDQTIEISYTQPIIITDINNLPDLGDYQVFAHGESDSRTLGVMPGNTGTNTIYIVYDGNPITGIYHLIYTPGDNLILNGNDRAAASFNAIIGDDTHNLLEGYLDADTFMGNGGDDVISGNEGDDFIDGGDDGDQLFGNAGNDFIDGGNGDDRLYGGEGDDVIDGGDGIDTIYGGEGNDILTGGGGADTFFYDGPDSGRDIITDFEIGIDALNLINMLDTSSGGTYSDFIEFIDNGMDTTINIDADGIDSSGNFNTDVSITLQGHTGGGFDLTSMLTDGSIM